MAFTCVTLYAYYIIWAFEGYRPNSASFAVKSITPSLCPFLCTMFVTASILYTSLTLSITKKEVFLIFSASHRLKKGATPHCFCVRFLRFLCIHCLKCNSLLGICWDNRGPPHKWATLVSNVFLFSHSLTYPFLLQWSCNFYSY